MKVLVLKEVCKVSLRYAEGLSTAYFGVPKSTLHYWEMRHGDIVEEVLRMLFKLLSLIEYDYSIIDSTKVTEWGLHELFINVKGGSTLFPVQLTGSEVEFAGGMPEGSCLVMGIRR